MSNITIAYGSESGSAKQLALKLNEQLQEQLNKTLQSFNLILCELNDIVISSLHSQDILLIISSSFGDGEPPANASTFFDELSEYSQKLSCQFAVFGLGDVSYPKFCGFTLDLDNRLQQLKATAIANRVDADISYQGFFEQWSQALFAHFLGNTSLLTGLNLQVKAYGEDQSYLAKIASVKRINQGDFPVYDIEIDITGSGMNYQAGDLLYMLPPVNQPTFERVLQFYGLSTKQQNEKLNNQVKESVRNKLAKKELRLLNKPLIRAFLKQTKNDELKPFTKMSHAKQLAEYIYGRDIADLLVDYCTPETMPIEALLNILSTTLPRAYSIASCGSTSPSLVRLCVREVNYQLDGKNYVGSGSHFLCDADAQTDAQNKSNTEVNVYTRANAHFHLPEDPKTPVIMIGSGTGIAPYLGFLSSKQSEIRTGEAHLFFGERYRATDYLYEQALDDYLESGQLTSIYTAFSREQAEKIYVQDVLLEQGESVWRLIEQGAHLYVCGSKANLNKSINNSLSTIAQTYGKLDENDAKNFIYTLVTEQRYHQDLY